MEKSETYRKGSGASKKWDGGGPYGGGPRGPPRGMDNVRGIDHSEFSVNISSYHINNLHILVCFLFC